MICEMARILRDIDMVCKGDDDLEMFPLLESVGMSLVSIILEVFKPEKEEEKEMRTFRVDFYDCNGDCVFTPFLERETVEETTSFALDKLMGSEELVRFEIVELVQVPVEREAEPDKKLVYTFDITEVNNFVCINGLFENATQSEYALWLNMLSDKVDAECIPYIVNNVIDASPNLSSEDEENILLELMEFAYPEIITK